MREYLLTLLVAAAVTYLLTPLARRAAVLVGATAPVRDRDVHAIPTPRLGGVAMFAGVVAALLVARRLPHLAAIFADSSAPVAVVWAGLILTLVGALDDRFELDALTKLSGQIAAAGVLVAGGVQLLWLPIPRFGTLVLSTETGALLTVVLVVLTVNAVNFIDGLDGLAAGVVAIAATAFYAWSYFLAVVHGFSRQAPPMLVTAVLIGACAGFLPHNFNPARVFMGDSGSMLIGLLLATATISLTGQVDANALTGLDLVPALLPLLLPLAVLALPLVDLLLAVARRSMAGRSPFAPDKQHLHHRLLEIGHSQTRAVLILYFWSALLAFTAVALGLTGGPMIVLLAAAALAVVGLVSVNRPRLRARRP